MHPSAATLSSLIRRTGRNRALHLSWMAFFLAFLVWFDFAPFSSTIGHHLHLTKAQLTTIGLCNLGLTVPARFALGMALDRFGPRRVFAAVLLFAAVPNTVFACASNFDTLVASRLALSVVGAAFVVGIRMVAEWWPDEELGTAEGVYGGWGNFGGGVATVALPVLAGWLGGADGWRWSIGLTGLLAGAWGIVYLVAGKDTADGGPWRRPARQGALEVTTRGAAIGLAALSVPVVGIVGVIAYEVRRQHVIGTGAFIAVLVALAVLATVLVLQVVRVNAGVLRGEAPTIEPYSFRSVALCCGSYMVTFGGELAVLSILPTFFGTTWKLGLATAGAAAGTFGLMNLITRPTGGIVSDASGRRTRVLAAALAGTAVGFVLMSTLGRSWPVGLAVVLAIAAAAALQFGNGACFSIVPQIRRQAGGQIAGLTGAYGNLGGALLLFAALYVRPQTVFLLVGVGALVVGGLVAVFLPEPATGRSPTVSPAGDTAAAPALVRS